MRQHFDQQKENIKYAIQAMVAPIILAVFVSVLIYVIIPFAADAPDLRLKLYAMATILPLTCIFLIILLISRIKMLADMNKIPMIREEEKEIICRKVRVISVKNNKFGMHTLGFVLTDEYNKKHYCILAEPKFVHMDLKKFIKSKCLNQHLKLKCYSGSKFLIDPPFTMANYDYE